MKQKTNAPTLEECMRCEPSGGIPHHCCRTPGFAVFENIELIYEKYVNQLWESVPFGNKNLDIEQFIQLYFTLVTMISSIDGKNVMLKLFFPKIIDYTTLTNELTGKIHKAGPRIMADADLDLVLRLPEDFMDFYSKRNYDRPGNQGCVFLKRGEEPLIQNCMGCLLHTKGPISEISPKPIDCISFNCKLALGKEEREEMVAMYFYELLKQFGTFE